MAETAYTYSIANDFPDVGPCGVCYEKLLAAIGDSSITTELAYVRTDDDVCKIAFVDALSAAEKTTLDGDTTGPAGGLIATYTSKLALNKEARCGAVDLKSMILIGGGFTYDSTQFSLSANAQMNWTNLVQNKANWTYPVKVSTFPGPGEYSISDSAVVDAFYEAGINRVKEILDGGRQLKLDIAAAADQAALDAIVDDRT